MRPDSGGHRPRRPTVEATGLEPKERPEIRRIWVYADKQALRWEWDGMILTIRIAIRSRAENPIVFQFRPRGKYKRLMKAWARGKCK